jgi:hypothetical protein
VPKLNADRELNLRLVKLDSDDYTLQHTTDDRHCASPEQLVVDGLTQRKAEARARHIRIRFTNDFRAADRRRGPFLIEQDLLH